MLKARLAALQLELTNLILARMKRPKAKLTKPRQEILLSFCQLLAVISSIL